MYETGELFVTNCDETCTDDIRLESAAAGLWAWPTNCNSLKLSLWDSDARAQRESSACLRMSARLFARKKGQASDVWTSALHTGTDVSSLQQ